MGCRNSKEVDDRGGFDGFDTIRHHLPSPHYPHIPHPTFHHHGQNHGQGHSQGHPAQNRPPTSAYLALALLNANMAAASVVASDLHPERLENHVAEQLIRRAKNDGQTVSIINNCLYLDYKFVGFMPGGVER